jgi:hypothetical protein
MDGQQSEIIKQGSRKENLHKEIVETNFFFLRRATNFSELKIRISREKIIFCAHFFAVKTNF